MELSSEQRARIQEAKEEALARVEAAADEAALEEARVFALGKSGVVSGLRRTIGKLPHEERKAFGGAVNEAIAAIEAALDRRGEALAAAKLREELEGPRLDLSLPGRAVPLGRRHPISRTMEDLIDLLGRLGFEVAEGPEVELDYYNFEALNFPKDHPARDMQDTFFVDEGSIRGGLEAKGGVLLRTHTSPVQVRAMLGRRPPLRIIAPGRVYRNDSDQTHSPMFHQIEGLYVDRKVSFAELKGTLAEVARGIFGPEVGTRFRPSFFPFTEPSAEVDVSCVICGGSGRGAEGANCRVCKGTGWLEILGAGMVDPEVFRHAGYDPDNVSGFAFGLGVERIAMLRYGIDDLRLLFENDTRFLAQF